MLVLESAVGVYMPTLCIHLTLPVSMHGALAPTVLITHSLFPLQSQKKGKGQPLTDSYSHHRLPSDQTTLFATSLHWVEAIALVAMCSYRPVTRRVALMILKEVRQLREVLGQSLLTDDANVMDVIDKAAPDIIAQHIETLMPSEKVSAGTG